MTMPSNEILMWIALLASGFLAGVVNSVAGGGTLFTFPALLFSGLDPIRANATSTVALIVGIWGSISGYWRHFPQVRSWLVYFTPVSLVGGLLGGILLTRTPSRTFEWLVPVLILFATILFMLHGAFSRFSSRHGRERVVAPTSWLSWAIVFQFLVAIYGGYFGAGIGILMLASLGMMGLRDIHQMNTVKTVLGGLINLVAAAYFVWKGLIDWPRAGVVALASSAGYFYGSRFAQRISQNTVRKVIAAVGLAISAVMFYEQFVR